jgi:hypothetical protein
MPGPAIKQSDPFHIQDLPVPIRALINLIAPPDDPLGGLSPTPLASVYRGIAGKAANAIKPKSEGMYKISKGMRVNNVPPVSAEDMERMLRPHPMPKKP